MRTCVLVLLAFSVWSSRAYGQACVEDVRALIDEALPYVDRVELITQDGKGYVGEGETAERNRVQFYWSAETGLRTVSLPTVGITAVSANGAFVVIGSVYRWETATGTVRELGLPEGADRFVPRAVTNDGTVFGSALESFVFAGSYRWTPTGFTLLSDTYVPTDVSNDGTVGLGVESGTNEPHYLWRSGTNTWDPIDGFPDEALRWYAEDLSGDGRHVTGWYEREGGATMAYRWTGGTVRSMPGWAPGSFDGGQSVANNGAVLAGRALPPDFTPDVVRWTGDAVQSVFDVLTGEGIPAMLAGRVEGFSDDGRVFFSADDGRQTLRLDGDCAVGLAGGNLAGATLRGGATWPVGWIPSGLSTSDLVTIAWSRDGTRFTDVGTAPAISTEDGRIGYSGFYRWTVPNVEADSAYLRFSVSGVEDYVGPFAIEPDESLTASWIGTIRYPYTEPDAWSIGEAPGPGYTVLFSDANDQYVSSALFFEDATARSLIIDDATTFDLNENAYRLEEPGMLTIGSQVGLEASLYVKNGAFVAGDVELGLAPSPRRATLVAEDVMLTAGLMTVSRADSARVEVDNGTTATLRSGLWIGSEVGSDGEVDVVGGTLQVTEAALGTLVGDEGQGKLLASDGGMLSLVGPVDVGASASGNGLLMLTDGASGSTLGSLQIGTAGVGGLEVTGGATLISNAVALGVEAGSFGTALVEGVGSRWEVTGPMQIGVAGAALFQMQDGAIFCKRDVATYTIGSQGSVNIVGEVVIGLDVCPEAVQEGHASRRLGDAVLAVPALTLAAGATLEAESVRLASGGTLGGDGALALPLTNAGTLAPGGPGAPGVFTASSGYAQGAAGTLLAELGGAVPGSGHDQLVVAGTATLGGTLTLALLDGFVPNVGDAFTLVAADEVLGAFAAVEAPEGVEVAVVYEAGRVLATVTGVTVSQEDKGPLPTALVLNAPYPNPTRAASSMQIDLPSPARVRVLVYDALGREVATALDDERPAGRHTVELATDGLATGVYVVRLVVGSEVRAQRLAVVR